ncbi:hypothetical protein FSL15_09745 [Campylobacter jejuni]|nr:hypothetical protein [Campylobacter jejuni]ECL2449893.1 hypothetical protein [Campylobacter jejuni]
MTLTINNADEKLLKAVQNIVSLSPKATLEIEQEIPSGETIEALNNPVSCGVFENYEDFKKALQD